MGEGGSNNGISCMLNFEGNQCCIGFLASAIGLGKDKLRPFDTETVPRLEDIPINIKQYLPKYDYHIMHKLYSMNDVFDINDINREQVIQELGKQIGVNFQFTN